MALINKWIANIWQQEAPTGTVNGINTVFTLSATPLFSSGVNVYLNGTFQRPTTDYTISGSTITFTSAPATDTSVYVTYIKRL